MKRGWTSKTKRAESLLLGGWVPLKLNGDLVAMQV